MSLLQHRARARKLSEFASCVATLLVSAEILRVAAVRSSLRLPTPASKVLPYPLPPLFSFKCSPDTINTVPLQYRDWHSGNQKKVERFLPLEIFRFLKNKIYTCIEYSVVSEFVAGCNFANFQNFILRISFFRIHVNFFNFF